MPSYDDFPEVDDMIKWIEAKSDDFAGDVQSYHN